MNIKKYLRISLLLYLPIFLQAQVNFINTGAMVKVNNGINLRVENGSITNKNTGGISNEGNIYLDLNFIQNTGGDYIGSAASWLWFEGAANQNIISDAPLNISRLRVDNGNRLIINNSVTTKYQVDLTNNGNIELGNFNLIMHPGATITGYDAANYIITNGTGFLQREVAGTNEMFPVGNTTYNPATLQNTGTPDNFQVRVFDQLLDEGTTGFVHTENGVGRTWMISEEIVGGSNLTTTLQWNTADELASFDRTNSGISHHLSGTLWDNPTVYTAATSVGAAWSQTRTGFTSFSPFVVRDFDNIGLPVELLYFNANRQIINQVNLDWFTASEINNLGFEIERMLENETEFTKIGWVDGKGTTTNTSYYDLIDNNGYEGVSYYRLKQIDFDGTFTYSDIKAVSGWKLEGNNIDVFPNPIHDYINIRLTSECKEIALRILDAKGALVLAQTKPVPADKLVQLDDLEHLADGVYLLTVTTDEGDVVTKKIIKKQR